jgi:hypothetical protein
MRFNVLFQQHTSAHEESHSNGWSIRAVLRKAFSWLVGLLRKTRSWFQSYTHSHRTNQYSDPERTAINSEVQGEYNFIFGSLYYCFYGANTLYIETSVEKCTPVEYTYFPSAFYAVLNTSSSMSIYCRFKSTIAKLITLGYFSAQNQKLFV